MAEPAPSRQTYSFTTSCCWLVILGIVGGILVRSTLIYRTASDRALTAVVGAPDVSLEITSRMMIGQTNLLSRVPGGSDPVLIARQRKKMVAALDSAAVTWADKLNTVAVIAELSGSDEAIRRLDLLEPKLAPNPLLADDVKVLRTIYMRGTEFVAAPQRQALVQRHEWFGQLALVFGLPAADPKRQAMLETAVQTTIVLGIVFLVLLMAVVIGLVLLIVAMVLLKKGRIRLSSWPSAATGPPVYLETFALWLGIWVVMSLVMRVLGQQQDILASEAITALLSLGVTLWPISRGVKWSQLREDLGWHFGRGVFREISAGVIGYIAGLPILAVGFLVTAVLIRESAIHPTHPILRELGSGANALSLVGIYIAACFLAPLVEETVFRGALYGHLRRRHRPIFCAIAVSLLFAAIRPQGWPAIPLLGSIAFILAILREWRGSLLSCMTAHALNNAAGVTIVVLVLRWPAMLIVAP